MLLLMLLDYRQNQSGGGGDSGWLWLRPRWGPFHLPAIGGVWYCAPSSKSTLPNPLSWSCLASIWASHKTTTRSKEQTPLLRFFRSFFLPFYTLYMPTCLGEVVQYAA